MEENFEIYLVYSAKDPDATDGNGWVFTLQKLLEMLLGRISGEFINVNSRSDQELNVQEIYSVSTILLPVISEELLNSHFFKEEIKIFHERAIHKSHNNISWESRVFKIFKEPADGHYLLDFLNNSVGYNFYHQEISTGEIIRYTDFTGPDSEKTFWMRLYDLAYDLWKIIEVIKAPEVELQEITRNLNALTVYLAETGLSLNKERDMIKRELGRLGVNVVPDRRLPDDIDALEKVVLKQLKQCKLSVHLVGTDLLNRKFTGQSITEVQNQIAIKYFNDLYKENHNLESEGIGRIIWIAPELEHLTLSQRIYLENIRKHADYHHSVEILECSIEEFKSFLLKSVSQLINGGSIKDDVVKQDYNGKLVYLIFDQDDHDKAFEIRDLLMKNGHKVILSDFQGTPEEVRSKHNESLKYCDATLIYHGNDNDRWVKSKLKDLAKALGLGREKPIFPQAIITDDSDLNIDTTTAPFETLILQKQDNQLDNNFLGPFLASLNKEV
ncbi:MAG: hypothetical protein JJU28_25145 [Cyclobacteriaceae bacterium]|nr:hypothetical protein [Cyclobacteriaceae bacterium]